MGSNGEQEAFEQSENGSKVLADFAAVANYSFSFSRFFIEALRSEISFLLAFSLL